MPPEHSVPRLQADSGLIALIANALLAIFVVNVLFQAVPLQILDTTWQLRLVGGITANGGFAITGFALLHLAANLDPANQRLAVRRRFARRWALAAALGFLLLVPLQGYAVWSGISVTRAEQVRQRNDTSQALGRVRQVVAGATSLQDLQQQLAAVQGPTLTPSALQRPLPEVKQALLQEADRVALELSTSPLGPRGKELWVLLQDNLRTVLLCLLFSVCFAAGSRMPNGAARGSSGLPLNEDLPLLTQIGTCLINWRRQLRHAWKVRSIAMKARPRRRAPLHSFRPNLLARIQKKFNNRRPRPTQRPRSWARRRF